jgi:hypothetical protein
MNSDIMTDLFTSSHIVRYPARIVQDPAQHSLIRFQGGALAAILPLLPRCLVLRPTYGVSLLWKSHLGLFPQATPPKGTHRLKIKGGCRVGGARVLQGYAKGIGGNANPTGGCARSPIVHTPLPGLDISRSQ